ncbi:MAG: TonB-dependent receptor [Candidatus Kapabacteria bacterium]|jgi:hypothetical protein|nr:TonB-dependent receptor [Candidatus Kapabacteria bacterium]
MNLHQYFTLSIFLLAFFNACVSSIAQTRACSGTVTESQSGEAIIGANVLVFRDSSGVAAGSIIAGARTNTFGFFSLPQLPYGSYIVLVRAVGYTVAPKALTVSEEITPSGIRLKAERKNVHLDSVTVSGKRSGQSFAPSISIVDISMETVKTMPALGGEPDVYRTIQLMPGVKVANEVSGGLYIRGGSPDQNLTMLDGIPVYNPLHLGGFLSTFNSDAISNTRLIKGAFPAEYGGRLSSVIDITMKEGTKEKFSGSGGVSLLASRLLLEGPIGDKATFMISGRRTYLDLLAGLISGGQSPDYNFHDVNAKFNWTLSDNDRIFVSGYLGQDFLAPPRNPGNEDGLFFSQWGNYTGQLRWTHIFSPTLFTKFTAFTTSHNFGLDTYRRNIRTEERSFRFGINSRLQDFGFRAEAETFFAGGHALKMGVDGVLHNFTTIARDSLPRPDFLRNLNQNLSSWETSAFIQDEWSPSPMLSTNFGVRVSHFQSGNHFFVEPRASVVFNLSEHFSLNAAFAGSSQFLHLLAQPAPNILVPTDAWFPSNERIRPSYSTQYVLGAKYSDTEERLEIAAEVYYKFLQNIYDYKDSLLFSNFVIPVESAITLGNGEAYGLEIFIQKTLGSITGWLGYTLSWTTRTFPDINQGRPFFPRYDRRHDISAMVMFPLGEQWDFSATWVFGTGQAFTMPSSTVELPILLPVQQDPRTQVTTLRNIVTERNSFRLPPFHKLDVNFIYKFQWFSLPFHLSLSVYNVYSRQNPDFARLGYTSNGNVLFIDSIFPIIPTVGLRFSW